MNAGKSVRVLGLLWLVFYLSACDAVALLQSKLKDDAEQAYLKSNGSFDAVIVSLLTSDSFIYRKENLED